MKQLLLLLLSICLFACQTKKQEFPADTKSIVGIPEISGKVSLIVLGNVQDAGSPQIGCTKKCCENLFKNPDRNRKITSLGIYDQENNKTFLFEASPDIITQTKYLKNYAQTVGELPDGIFLTHAHIGHYSGLMFLGKEAMNASDVPVYVMPKFKLFIETNGPWDQLVNNKNIALKALNHKDTLEITSNLKIIPFKVPHRDEYSETVGYTIIAPEKSVLFIPDIDKWEKWEESIIEKVKQVDYAFLDATFFDAEEINNRDISEIPHPFVIESMSLFSDLKVSEKKKIHFIHFNHTNPLLNPESKQTKEVLQKGYKIARLGNTIQL
ncbi:MBL fold metallo-hydrolase [Galbibacter orientalis]|uniref:MBL fold metallo-hydrolase n=1 Tax=Galbibacter orientalis TaxID=453852 RepID=UPI003080BE0F